MDAHNYKHFVSQHFGIFLKFRNTQKIVLVQDGLRIEPQLKVHCHVTQAETHDNDTALLLEVVLT